MKLDFKLSIMANVIVDQDTFAKVSSLINSHTVTSYAVYCTKTEISDYVDNVDEDEDWDNSLIEFANACLYIETDDFCFYTK